MTSKTMLFVYSFLAIASFPSVVKCSNADPDRQVNCDKFLHDLQAEIKKLRSSPKTRNDFSAFNDSVTDLVMNLTPEERSDLPAYFRTCDQIELYCLFIASCPFPEFAPFPYDDGAQPSHREKMSKLVCLRLISDSDFRREYHHYVAWRGLLKTASEKDVATGHVEQVNRHFVNGLLVYTQHNSTGLWSHRLTLYLYSHQFSVPNSIKFLSDECDPICWRKHLIEFISSNEFDATGFRYHAKSNSVETNSSVSSMTDEDFEYLPPVPRPIAPFSTPDDLLLKILENAKTFALWQACVRQSPIKRERTAKSRWSGVRTDSEPEYEVGERGSGRFTMDVLVDRFSTPQVPQAPWMRVNAFGVCAWSFDRIASLNNCVLRKSSLHGWWRAVSIDK